MSPNAIYSKTGKGVQEAAGKTSELSRSDRAVLASIDGRSTVAELHEKFSRMPRDAFEQLVERLDKEGFIRTVSAGKPQAAVPAAPPAAPPAAKSASLDASTDLDFSSIGAASMPASRPQVDLAAKARAEADARARAEQQAAAQAKARAEQEAATKAAAAAKARAEHEAAAKAAAAAKARAEHEAAAKAAAQKKAEAEARERAQRDAALRAVAEARARAEAEARAKIAAEVKARAEAEARAKAAQEAALRVAAEARAKAEAEAAAKLEAERKTREELERKLADLAGRLAGEQQASAAEEKGRSEAEELRLRLEEKRRAREAASEGAGARAGGAEEPLRKGADELRLKLEQERRIREEVERRLRDEAERRVREEAERKAADETEAKRKAEEEKARREIAAQHKAEDGEVRKEAEEAAKRAAEELEFREQSERLRREQEQAQREAEELARQKDEERQRKEEEEKRKKFEETQALFAGLNEFATKEIVAPKADAWGAKDDSIPHPERESAAAPTPAPMPEPTPAAAPAAPAEAHAAAEATARDEAAHAAAAAREAQAHKSRRSRSGRSRRDERARQAAGSVEGAQAPPQRPSIDWKKHAATASAALAAAGKKSVAIGKLVVLALARVIGVFVRASIAVYRGISERRAKARRARAEALREAPREAVAPAARRGAARKGTSFGLGFVALLLAGLAVLHFVPLPAESWEKTASAALGRPVRIGAARFSLIYGPELKIERVALGEQFRIPALSVAPRLATLLDDAPAVSRVEIENVTIPQSLLGELLFGTAQGEMLKGARIVARNVKLDGPANLPALDAEIRIGSAGRAVSASVRGPDGLVAKLAARDSGMAIEANANRIELPFGPKFALAEFSLSGTATRGAIEATAWDGTAFDGVISGTARILWSGGLSVSGEIRGRALNPAKFAAALVPEGRGEARGVYAMSAPGAAQLAASAVVRGRFTIAKGAIANADLSRAVQINGQRTSGRTPFIEMSGDFAYANGALALRSVAIATGGALSATASMDVAEDGALAGRIVAELAGRNQSMSATLPVTGTLKEPRLGH